MRRIVQERICFWVEKGQSARCGKLLVLAQKLPILAQKGQESPGFLHGWMLILLALHFEKVVVFEDFGAF
jgi:hypothetical protein